MVSDHWPSRNGFEALLPVADLLGRKWLEVRSVIPSPDKPTRLNWKMSRRCSRDVRMLRFPARPNVDLYRSACSGLRVDNSRLAIRLSMVRNHGLKVSQWCSN